MSAKIKTIVVAGALAALALFGFQKNPSAPKFSAMGSDGKTHTLESLTKDKTTVFYFISETCPVNNRAVPHYKALSDAYAKSTKVNFVGVFNGNKAAYDRYAKRTGLKIVSILDPELKVIRTFKAEASPWVIVVEKGGKIAATHDGYSKPRLEQLSKLIAKTSGMPVAKLDFSSAPIENTYG